ncbi:MAG: hypothetical protein MSH32_06795 [Lachnospiraceae bacterium]|nr:hypothetical protein [Lachnospiraceae bacterium]
MPGRKIKITGISMSENRWDRISVCNRYLSRKRGFTGAENINEKSERV